MAGMASGAQGEPGIRRTVFDLLERYGSLAALAVLIGLGVWMSPDAFGRPANFVNILRQSSFIGIIAIGMTFVIILGGIDLSVGSMVALLGGIGILAMNSVAGGGTGDGAGHPTLGIVAGAAVMLGGGAFLGFVTGVLIAKGRIAPFIATLGGMAAFRSLALAIRDGGEYSTTVPSFGVLGTGGLKAPFVRIAEGVPLTLHYPVLVFLLGAVAAHLLLKRTTFGLYVHAIGDNERAAAFGAVPIARVRVLTYTLMGVCSGLAALLISSRMNSVSSSQTGTLYELDAIAAVVVGGTRMTGGAGRVWGTVVGVLILGVVNNLLNMLSTTETLGRLGLEHLNMTHLQGLVKGAIIVAAVLVQRSGRSS
jgi:ribose transport system permease protein